MPRRLNDRGKLVLAGLAVAAALLASAALLLMPSRFGVPGW